MAKYTTEVRNICEVYAGAEESKGYNDIENIIASARDKIFDFNYPIFDESYKATLETKILRAYYTNEICCETVGLWKHFLCDKMNRIMPYFNQLYESARVNYNPLTSTEMNTAHNIEGSNNSIAQNQSKDNNSDNEVINRISNKINNDVSEVNNNDVSQSTTNGKNDVSKTNMNKYSDTPQGTITNLINGTYLTNATQDSGEENTNTNAKETSTNQSNTKQNNERNETGAEQDEHVRSSNKVSDNISVNNGNTTEHYIEQVAGRNISGSELLLKWRETFINIDEMVIDSLYDLFFLLW